MPNEYYVYELWNPIKNQPFYVGFAKRRCRPQDHINEALSINSEIKLGANPHKIYTIRNIHTLGFHTEIRIVYITKDKQDAINKEIELIRLYGRTDINTGILTNMTDGGEGTGRRYKSIIEREKLSKARLGKTFEEIFGEKRAVEIKDKISRKKSGAKTNKPAWNTGKTKYTDTNVKKISDSRKGQPAFNKGKHMKELNPNYINHFKGRTHTTEAKEKISKANKGKCANECNPMYGKSAVKGRKWYHNNITQYYLFETDDRIKSLNLIKGRLH